MDEKVHPSGNSFGRRKVLTSYPEAKPGPFCTNDAFCLVKNYGLIPVDSPKRNWRGRET